MLKNLPNIIEGMLFVAGNGVECSAIEEKLQIDHTELENALTVLEEKYSLSSGSGINLIRFKDKIQLCTNPEYAEVISDVLNPIRERALSKTALETIAIIAYQQPITKLEIENIRGVSSDYAIQLLLSHNLIEVVGRKDVVGKPLLFGTTDEFLKRFELKSLEDLPKYEELLEQIKVLNVESGNDSLYNEFEVVPLDEADAEVEMLKKSAQEENA